MFVDRAGKKLQLRTRESKLQTAQKDGDSCFETEIKKIPLKLNHISYLQRLSVTKSVFG